MSKFTMLDSFIVLDSIATLLIAISEKLPKHPISPLPELTSSNVT